MILFFPISKNPLLKLKTFKFSRFAFRKLLMLDILLSPELALTYLTAVILVWGRIIG